MMSFFTCRDAGGSDGEREAKFSRRVRARANLREAVPANLQRLLDRREANEIAPARTTIAGETESAERQGRRGEGRGDVGVNIPDWQFIHEALKRFCRPREDRRRETEG